MKKLIASMIFILLLTGCQSKDVEEVDYGKLMESSVTERFYIENGEENLSTVIKVKYNDHNKATEVVYYYNDGSEMFTFFTGYDSQDRVTTDRTVDGDKNLEVKHQYATSQKLQTTIYEYGELVSTVDYIYYTEDNYITNISNANGDITHTNETTMISEGVYTTLSKDIEFDKVTHTQNTYDSNDNLIEAITTVNNVLVERYESTYDDHNNVTSRKLFKYVKDGDMLLWTTDFKMTYDTFNNVVKTETFTEGVLDGYSITTITYVDED